ncbi:hypothetical protein AAHA92_17490 [Salvia divinorum]|uniref:Uncharacterized protein n=1 Tax=Salvia divinorum TaxID=28513 RepID=A0ABD1GYX6_SALDI
MNRNYDTDDNSLDEESMNHHRSLDAWTWVARSFNTIKVWSVCGSWKEISSPPIARLIREQARVQERKLFKEQYSKHTRLSCGECGGC